MTLEQEQLIATRKRQVDERLHKKQGFKNDIDHIISHRDMMDQNISYFDGDKHQKTPLSKAFNLSRGEHSNIYKRDFKVKLEKMN
mmetsp:Transcript_32855/g.50233  ORF Transcript_32855/g.50233 Transcript_32855/m.50233 type:complete len:85 (+) Transcript_32855:2436-2690(+)